jgi:5'-nucleotidase
MAFRILVSNDDGVYSPGIAALAEVAAEFGTVRVVAPDVEMSSAGHSITAWRPLDYKPTPLDNIETFRVNGTPADCVALGMFHQRDVDVVLSGVNMGPNMGNSLWHSGTLAAAHQAALLGARGIAFSTPVVSDSPDVDGLAPYLERVLELLLPRTQMRLVNVNLPAKPRGIHWVRQAVEQYDGEVVPANDPYNRPIYWIAVTQLREHAEGTDLWAFERGYITVTPIALGLTDAAALPAPDEAVIEFPDVTEPELLHESDKEAMEEVERAALVK